MINEVRDVMVGLADEGMAMTAVTHEMAFARRAAREFLSTSLHRTSDAAV